MGQAVFAKRSVCFNVCGNQMGGVSQTRTVQDGCCQLQSNLEKNTESKTCLCEEEVFLFHPNFYSCQSGKVAQTTSRLSRDAENVQMKPAAVTANHKYCILGQNLYYITMTSG